MPRYLDTSGKSSLAIGVCGRCGVKMPIGELMPDPNTPGVRVCRDDLDQLDPWRLAPRPSDRITVQFARPDTDLTPGPVTLPIPITRPWSVPFVTEVGNVIITDAGQLLLYSYGDTTVSTVQPALPWMPNTAYAIGQQVIPVGQNSDTVLQFLCISAGTSGAVAPPWPTTAGLTAREITPTNTLVWFANGVYFP